jgi:hypothetical protein
VYCLRLLRRYLPLRYLDDECFLSRLKIKQEKEWESASTNRLKRFFIESSADKPDTHIIAGSIDIGGKKTGIRHHYCQHPAFSWITALLGTPFPPGWPGNSLARRTDMQELGFEKIAAFGR